jgi:nucleotide-binding universal stress UspA family protein
MTAVAAEAAKACTSGWSSAVNSGPATVRSKAASTPTASPHAELDEVGLQASRDVAERGARFARDAGFESRTRVECGPVWRTIAAIAADEDAAAIGVGARGLSRAAAVLGSVSARVSRHAGRPVLVVPPSDDQPGETESPSFTPRTA